ncbi:hypothetical protein J3R82DRAFT_4809 [Butyriboletus roseoflavus]|nr:hypothetical protein J3R82DRAFT_4809 [Butyriboletus roseoflavus]
MKNQLIAIMVVFAVVFCCGQTIELGYPTKGSVLKRGKSFTAEVVLPVSDTPTRHELIVTYFYQISMASCIQVGIALAVAPCSGACPQPQSQLGDVLYAGPWNPVTPKPGYGYIQDFTVTIPQSMPKGAAIFTLTHLCLLGASALKTRRRPQHPFSSTGLLPSKSYESKGVTDRIIGYFERLNV